MSDIRIERCCDGCKRLIYSAHDGQPGYPGCDPVLRGPHVRCGLFKAYIPVVKEGGRGGATRSRRSARGAPH